MWCYSFQLEDLPLCYGWPRSGFVLEVVDAGRLTGGRQRATSASNSSSGSSRRNCSVPSTRYSIAVTAIPFRVRVIDDGLSPKHPHALYALPLKVGGDTPHMPRATTEEGGSLYGADQGVLLQFCWGAAQVMSV